MLRTRPGIEPVATAAQEPIQVIAGSANISMPDVALGMGSLLAEFGWRCSGFGFSCATATSAWAIAAIRWLAPQMATDHADARLMALAQRGQLVRRERTTALSETVSTTVTSWVTSDTVRAMTVSAIEQTTGEVLDVVMPAVLDAVSDEKTQDRLDELLAGLLMRQLPSALEKTLPGVMLRTATRPALGFVPSLMGAITSSRSQEASASIDLSVATPVALEAPPSS